MRFKPVWTPSLPRKARSFPGFGHRFHPVDPLSAPLLALVDEVGELGAVSGRFAAIGRAVEASLAGKKRQAHPDEHRWVRLR